MPHYPHSRLFIGPTKTVDIAGPYIQVIHTSTGAVVHSTTTFPDEQKAALLKSGPVRCAAVDREFRYLVTSGEDKMLKLWELHGMMLLSERELPKKPTSVVFTADAQTILVSDKFGDVFSYPFTYVPLTVKQKKDALSSHENPSGGQLILGHASPLNAFLLTPDEKYVITADRDEHIRVSWYPKGYNIEMYCLGHLKFVSAIHIPTSDGKSLISGGGDPMLKVWDWMTGAVKHEIEVLGAVEPFMAVRALKRKRGLPEDDGEGKPEGTKFRKKKGRGKKQENEVEVVVKEAEMEVDGEGEGEGASASLVEEKPEQVLVIHRIESVESDSEPYVVFSAVGATALFGFPYKAGVSASDIRHFDFGRPVIDFSVVDGKSVIVSLDGEWVSEETKVSTNDDMVRVVKVSGGEFVEDSEIFTTLKTALNSSLLLPATAEDIKKLDLYSPLVSMPKYASDAMDGDGEVEGGDGSLPIGAPELSSSETAKGRKGQELSKKELGRMKTKQAVLAKAQEMEVDGKEEEDGPEPKRAREDVTGA